MKRWFSWATNRWACSPSHHRPTIWSCTRCLQGCFHPRWSSVQSWTMTCHIPSCLCPNRTGQRSREWHEHRLCFERCYQVCIRHRKNLYGFYLFSIFCYVVIQQFNAVTAPPSIGADYAKYILMMTIPPGVVIDLLWKSANTNSSCIAEENGQWSEARLRDIGRSKSEYNEVGRSIYHAQAGMPNLAAWEQQTAENHRAAS